MFLLTIELHFSRPTLIFTIVGLVGGVPLASVGFLAWWTRAGYDPSWYKMSFMLMLTAYVCGIFAGEYNYYNYLLKFYQIERLQTYPHVDVGKESGQHLQDAGRVYFAAGTVIDPTRTWHFKAGSTYCVAPLISSPGQETVDFWAVGKDCCGTDSSDFRCGDFSNSNARAGLRFIESGVVQERQFFRLAVQGAEAVFKLSSPSPLFFEWSQDPLALLNESRDRGWGHLTVGCLTFFVYNIFAVIVATTCFACLGRGKSEKAPLLG